MAQLPADRTKLAQAQSNLTPSVVASSQKLKDAVTEAYDTVDLLNQKVNDHGAAVTLPHADKSVTRAKLADKVVGAGQLDDAAVGQSHHQDNGIPGRALPDNVILQRHMSDNSVGSAEIQAGAVQRTHIQTGAVGSSQLDPTLLQNFGDIAVQAKFTEVDAQLAEIAYICDDIANLQTLYNSVAENSTVKLTRGTHEFSNKLTFNRRVNLDFEGSVLRYIGSETGSIVTIGDFNSRIDSIYIDIHLEQAINWIPVQTGIEIVNIRNSEIHTSAVGFKNNVKVNAENGHPNSYNKYFLNLMDTSELQLLLTSQNGGWTNENIFYGGNFSYWSSTDTTNAVCVKIEYIDYRNNNNKFYGCSFEDSNLKATAIDCNGANNAFHDCRYEGAKKIFFGTQALYNVLAFGWDLDQAVITDNGTKNSIMTSNYLKFVGGNAAGVFQAKQTNGATAKLFAGLDNSDVEAFSVTSAGKLFAKDCLIANFGIRYGGDETRGIFRGTVNPEGSVVASPGSIYVRTNGAAGQTVWFKESGTGNTGWMAAGNSYLTSITSIPSFVGQEALVGGLWYKAIGTSATTDWKQITN